MAKVLVVCTKTFNGHELWVLLGELSTRGHTYEIVSQAYIITDERDQSKYTLTRLIKEVPVDEMHTVFDGLAVIAGNPHDRRRLWDDIHALILVHATNEQQKTIGAICTAVPTIRYAVDGKKVSYYSLLECRQLITRAGGIYNNVAVTRDGNIITGENDMASEIWAREFCLALEGRPSELKLVPSAFTLKLKDRKPIPGLEKIKGIIATTGRKNLTDNL